MNSSGIKRGLAGSAIAALAVTGLPFLASSASAATPEMKLLTAGPARNGGDLGGLVVLQTKDVVDTDVEGTDPTPGNYDGDLALANTALTGLPNSPTQSVDILNAIFVPNADDSNPDDGYDTVLAFVKTTTSTTGDAAKYAVYLDSDAGATADGPDVDASEPRVQVSATTAGAPASISVDPASQTVAKDQLSSDFTATLKDSAGRVTQLNTAESAVITTAATTTVEEKDFYTGEYNDANVAGADVTISAADAPAGSQVFKAEDSSAGPASIDIPIKVGADTLGKANLSVVASAVSIEEDDVDVVTDADGWDGFGQTDLDFGDTVPVRVDQSSIRIDIADSDNKNKTVVFQVAGGNGVKFGGKTTTSVTTVLDSSGNGTVTVTPDAGTITAGGTISVTGSGVDLPFEFQRSEVQDVTSDADTYISSFGGSVTVTVTAEDQFGLPATGTYVGARRDGGANEDASETKKAVDANGQATFTFTDTKATAASHDADDVLVSVYADQFAADPVSLALTEVDVADIVYSESGLGGDFALSADSNPVANPAYDPTAGYATLPPLTDGVDSGDAEDVNIGVTGGTAGAPVTIAVDGDALVLPTGKSKLSDGVASYSTALDGAGEATFNVIGTKAGTVTVTVTSGGRTKTAQVTVKPAADNSATARNISVSGPAEAKANDVVTFTAVVTDAFGNPVANFDPNGGVIATLTGPASILSNSGKSNANGVITYQVQLSNSAASSVSLILKGVGAQFGAAANFIDADDDDAPGATPTGPGLTASTDSATATIADVVNIAELEEAVEEAQAKVDAAQDALDAAKGDRAVARAEKSVAQAEVKQAKKDLKKAKKHHKGVKAAQKALREAKGDLKVATAKVNAANAKVNRAKDRLADAQAELEAAQQALEDAQNNG